MSLREGEEHRCVIHDFHSSDTAAYNKHCWKYPDIHTLSGETPCMICGRVIVFENMPHTELTPNGWAHKFICPECGTMPPKKMGKGTISLKEGS